MRILLAVALALACLAPRAGEIVFSDATETAGLAEPLAGLMGHGGAWGDFDGDGKIDLFVGGFCDRPNAEYAPSAGPVSSRLFRNKGDGTFERVSQPGVEFFARTSGAVFADLDNNGTLELYAANNAKAGGGKGEEPQKSAKTRHSILFRNDKGRLADISVDSGACPEALLTARNIGVFDYDNDGLLDLLVLEDKFTRNPKSLLLHNKGGLKFEVANAAVGLPDDLFGLGVAVADLNGDGRPDFFVGHSNRLFLSQPDGKYREATELKSVFAWQPFNGEDWPCGAAFCDLNRDGKLDLVITAHCEKARIRLLLGGDLKDGIPQFRDVTQEAGLAGIVPTKTPHVEFQDFDNDGWPDLYVSAAWVENGKVTPLIFRHGGLKDGIPQFQPNRPIQPPMVYFPAGPSGDYDNDGRLDLFLINWFSGRRSTLLHNESPKKRWLDVQVVGKTMNRMGIGAQVRISAGGKLLGFQEISTGYGYASGQRAYAHFGLGDAARVDVEVKLPSGKKLLKEGVEADRLLTVEEP
ncbi:MAG: CRTAC1 family protein [Planctomycetes bacterium]|nr:CRTAC1 family protein [Planctomycetota bacterium]